ncbi:MAG: hypothetical protein IPJ41_14665 [Phycisphaerales bacterium]|nr:hypothetical protein [Phycisphaerales bacterium]
MGSRLSRRIGRLERRPGGPRGPCPACRGLGRITLVDERRGQTLADARGCGSCGKVSKVILLEAGDDDGAAD